VGTSGPTFGGFFFCRAAAAANGGGRALPHKTAAHRVRRVGAGPRRAARRSSTWLTTKKGRLVLRNAFRAASERRADSGRGWRPLFSSVTVGQRGGHTDLWKALAETAARAFADFPGGWDGTARLDLRPGYSPQCRGARRQGNQSSPSRRFTYLHGRRAVAYSEPLGRNSSRVAGAVRARPPPRSTRGLLSWGTSGVLAARGPITVSLPSPTARLGQAWVSTRGGATASNQGPSTAAGRAPRQRMMDRLAHKKLAPIRSVNLVSADRLALARRGAGLGASPDYLDSDPARSAEETGQQRVGGAVHRPRGLTSNRVGIADDQAGCSISRGPWCAQAG